MPAGSSKRSLGPFGPGVSRGSLRGSLVGSGNLLVGLFEVLGMLERPQRDPRGDLPLGTKNYLLNFYSRRIILGNSM